MNVRTFHAANMAAALALVKRELGANAVILHTRTVRRGGWFGIGARTMVELTAAPGAEVGKARRRAAAAAAARQPAPDKGRAPQSVARPSLSVAAARNSESGATPLAGDLIRRTYAAARAEFSAAAAAGAAGTGGSPSALLTAPPRDGLLQTPPPSDTHAAQLTVEMQAVKKMVARVMRQQRQGGSMVESITGAGATSGGGGTATLPAVRPDLPDKLLNQYLALLEREVAEELAEEIVQQVHDQLGPPQLADDDAVRDAVFAAVAKLLPTDPVEPRDLPDAARSASLGGRPRTIALVGPTGVGKTTTIAKLAATFKLKQRRKVGLITLDTYRIAAVDQLRTYADIIGVPLHVVTNADELHQAQQQCAGCDVVLIDTAGRSQRDDPKLEQLASLIRAADPHEVHLVLSCTCSQTVMLETVERFSRIRADRIIFTKLDEAVSLGVLLNVVRRVNKRLSFVTTGQEVPHQIEPSCSKRLAALVLGQQSL